ncbi:MAG TPA: hypothetical protein VH396_15620 [Chitinophagaceae bacterium]
MSLSYDVIKAHGGEISVRIPSEKVETLPCLPDRQAAGRAGKEGEGIFIVQLPIV